MHVCSVVVNRFKREILKYTILIVDDDPSICQILTKILTNQGYRTITAVTCSEVRSILKKEHIDLILLDLMLPDGDGIDLAKEIIQKNSQLPIILISAHGTIERAVEATKIGVYDFLEKPFDRNRLLITIRNALTWSKAQEELQHFKEDSLAKYRMVGKSKLIQHVFKKIDKIAPMSSNVLIFGPTGSGKELVARAIHLKSQRAKERMVKVNCSAIPESLIESELFGHTKGAFTGATVTRAGKFEAADKGTLFLDEIGDLALPAQAKILRVLDSGEIQRIGSEKIQIVDVRVIAATNRNLQKMIDSGTFRSDLFYRLNVVSITVPSLKERKEDIPLLLEYFNDQLAEELGMLALRFTKAAINYLCGYEWPGNVRELRNFVEKAFVLTDGNVIDLEHCKRYLDKLPEDIDSLDDTLPLKKARAHFEKSYIEKAIVMHGNNITKAAEALGLDRTNLYRKMKELGIR